MRALYRSLGLALTLALMSTAIVVPLAWGQEQPDQQDQTDEQESTDPADERATTFRAVDGPVTEDVPGGALMVAAYAVVWLLIFGYIWRLGRISAATRADVQRLQRSLAAASSEPTAAGGDASDEG